MLNSSFLYTSQTDGLKTDLKPEHDHKIYNISIPTNSDPTGVGSAVGSPPPLSSNTYKYFLQPVRENFVEGLDPSSGYLTCYPVTEETIEAPGSTLVTAQMDSDIHQREYTLQIVVVFFTYIFLSVVIVGVAPWLYLTILNSVFNKATKENIGKYPVNVRILEIIYFVFVIGIFVTFIALAYADSVDIPSSAKSGLSLGAMILAGTTFFAVAAVQWSKYTPEKNTSFSKIDFQQLEEHKYKDSFPWIFLTDTSLRNFVKGASGGQPQPGDQQNNTGTGLNTNQVQNTNPQNNTGTGQGQNT
jgi:hypothetical protein